MMGENAKFVPFVRLRYCPLVATTADSIEASIERPPSPASTPSRSVLPARSPRNRHRRFDDAYRAPAARRHLYAPIALPKRWRGVHDGMRPAPGDALPSAVPGNAQGHSGGRCRAAGVLRARSVDQSAIDPHWSFSSLQDASSKCPNFIDEGTHDHDARDAAVPGPRSLDYSGSRACAGPGAAASGSRPGHRRLRPRSGRPACRKRSTGRSISTRAGARSDFRTRCYNNPHEDVPENLSDQWFEGFVKPALSGSYSGHVGRDLRQGERRWRADLRLGAQRCSGRTSRRSRPEDLYIGWRSGESLDARRERPGLHRRPRALSARSWLPALRRRRRRRQPRRLLDERAQGVPVRGDRPLQAGQSQGRSLSISTRTNCPRAIAAAGCGARTTSTRRRGRRRSARPT